MTLSRDCTARDSPPRDDALTNVSGGLPAAFCHHPSPFPFLSWTSRHHFHRRHISQLIVQHSYTCSSAEPQLFPFHPPRFLLISLIKHHAFQVQGRAPL